MATRKADFPLKPTINIELSLLLAKRKEILLFPFVTF